MASQTVENYLKALYNLSNAHQEVPLSELSNQLKVSTPTANSMVRKLGTDGLVVYKKYRPIKLTTEGRKQAALIIRKHRLTEIFLVEKMGFGWEEVHEIAEQMEHIKSSAFFDRMDELLGYPTVDPHGSPIPDKDGEVTWKSYLKLIDCQIGNRVVLSALTKSSDDFLKFLNRRSIGLGTILTVRAIEEFDHSMEIEWENGSIETISTMVSERILVEVIVKG